MKKIPFDAILLVLLITTVILIDLPEKQPIGNRIMNPPKIDFTIFGKRIQKSFTTKLGLDLRGGSHLLFEADTTKVPKSDVSSALESARNIIEHRVNFFGVSEPQVQTIQNQN